MCGLVCSRLSGEVKEEQKSSEQKQQESYILLSDSSEQVSLVPGCFPTILWSLVICFFI